MSQQTTGQATTIVVVTGGRFYNNRDHVYSVLDRVHAETPIRLLIEGGCPVNHLNADRLAREWAEDRNIPHLTCRADWTGRGKAAGPLRNREMAKARPHRCVAFSGGNGTNGCVDEMRAVGAEIVDEREVQP